MADRRLTGLAVLVLLGCASAGLLRAATGDPTKFALHPALEMSLLVSEPEVVDPVALTWDDEGRMYVVEMRDYPYGFGPNRRPGGAVRLLQDVDADGRIDKSIAFAENLSFPTSIAPWKNGVLVAAPPEIVFLADTNGDGKADVREVILEGFTLGVTDSNMNGLRWGLDNRLHGLNGGNGGNLTSPRNRKAPLSIRGVDFSLDPDSGDVAPTFQTSAGFGLVFDPWGRRFVTYNINHIQHQIIPVRYLRRFPGLPPTDAVENISDHGDMARIFPISVPETRVNHPEQSGHFSSAGGLGYIGLPVYVGDLFGSVLVCDVVGNLVHRDVLAPHGPTFRASRSGGETNSEFLASRDLAFRPVGLEMGPDGALYLLDMQRDVIEHPDYIPEKVLKKLDIRAGEARGRIYRITPKGGLPPRQVNLRRSAPEQLARHLADANPWWRLTAQRLLVERKETAALPDLVKLGRGKEAWGRLHALWTRQGLGALDEAALLGALDDPEAGIRENALVLAEPFLGNSEKLRRRVLALANDANVRVRFQAALTLGEFQHPLSMEALLGILRRDHAWRWSRFAALSSVRAGEEKLLQTILTDRRFLADQSAAKVALVNELADLIGARAAAGNLAPTLEALLRKELNAQWKLAVLQGLESGLARNRNSGPSDAPAARALEELARDASPALFASAWKLSRRLGLPETKAQRVALLEAGGRLADKSRTVEQRMEDLQVLGLGAFPDVGSNILALLDGREPALLQRAALEILSRFSEVGVAQGLIECWAGLAPASRPLALTILLQRIPFHDVLLTAIEQGKLALGELTLDLEQRRRLLRESTPENRARAAKWIGDEEYSNRKTVVELWLPRLPEGGDGKRGRVIFEKLCAQCHASDGMGHAVGPDLRALSHRSVEDLLSNILDPNMAINPAYASFTLETTSGEIQTGILASETTEAVTLRQALGKQITVPRSQIQRLASTGLSLMPEGVESGLTPAEMRDLIAFIQDQK